VEPGVTIVEVLGRSEQGATRPFLCRGDDERLYYVKGRYAGLNSLCCEWIAGNLAHALKLPIPRFAVGEVPESLVAASRRLDISDLGAGFVFASKRVEKGREITWAEAAACPMEAKARVLLFDWWVHNEDRILTARGGNPNLLTSSSGVPASLWVFDFNLAFDDEFSAPRFWANHLFAPMVQGWPDGFRERLSGAMHDASIRLGEWFASLPKEWLHIEGDENLPVQLDEKRVLEILSRPFTEPDRFWNRT
jgi:hypothetical protein